MLPGEEEIISTFQQFAKRMPLCLQGTASHVTIKNDGVLAPITGVQAKV